MAEPALMTAPDALAPAVESPLRIFWKRFRKRKPALVGLAVLLIMVFLAVAAPAVTSFDAEKPNLKYKFAEPLTRTKDGNTLWFGGDNLGRDVFTRAVYGARVSLKVGLLASALSLTIGVVIGALAGYYGGWVDNSLMRVVDIFLSIPSLLLLITVMAVYGPAVPKGGEVYLIVVILGILGWPGTARLVRGEFLSLKHRDFVEAARSLGSRDGRIIFLHILPNVIAPVIVSVTLSISGAIMSEATLSYLGLGIQPPIPSWGNMIQDGRDYMRNAWWIVTFPGLLAAFTTLSLYQMGDALREALDPKLKK